MAAGTKFPLLKTLWGRKFGITHDGELVLNETRISGKTKSGSAPTLWKNAPSRNDNDPYTYFEVFDDFMYPATSATSDVMAWTATNDGATGTPGAGGHARSVEP